MQFYAIADRGPNADVLQYDNGEKVTDAKIGIYTIDGKTAEVSVSIAENAELAQIWLFFAKDKIVQK